MRETLVIDASVAVKWLVAEEGADHALALRARFAFLAPELILAECANIFWKKATRGEMTRAEATLAAKLMEVSGVEFVSMAGLSEPATAIALSLGHPVYDCVYLALARRRGLRFVTADRRLVAATAERGDADLRRSCVSFEHVREN